MIASLKEAIDKVSQHPLAEKKEKTDDQIAVAGIQNQLSKNGMEGGSKVRLDDDNTDQHE